MDREPYRELFSQEAQELLVSLNRSLIALERQPGDEPTVGEIYRVMHTLKSMAATMGYQRTADLCHALESLLDRVLKGTVPVTPGLMGLLFTSADQIERLTGEEEERWDAGNESVLEKVRRTGELSASDLPAPRSEGAMSRARVGAAAQPPSALTVRIAVKRLDSLINLTGELLIIKSRLWRLAALGAPALKETVDQLARVSEDLQREVLQARMLPIGSVLDRFSRTVRDLARDSGKQAELLIRGQEIELDRTILAEISEPLLHLLRNAVAYGIEPPPERVRSGKPETGVITLSASREADRVVLEMQDDGKGIDLDELRAVAARKGFASAEQAQALSDQELVALLFLPGFSTATTVTEVSGRGVGLNIVKTRVEALRGSIEVRSAPREGTRFILRFPPSLAILEALLVRIREEMFAIPMVDIAEVLEVDRDEFETRNILLVRDKVVPVVDLARALGLGDGPPLRGRVPVLVSSLLEGAPGFIVDQVVGQQQIVIKPVERLLRHIAGLSGATILGDGRVVLILDLHALVREQTREQRAPAGRVAFSSIPTYRRTA
jgi:two-component system chemotaxis sensor kinase CheA